MALRVAVEREALVFRSAGYFLSFGIARLSLPGWLSPGDVTVRHRDVGGGSFVFELALVHRRWGELIFQAGLFEETKA